LQATSAARLGGQREKFFAVAQPLECKNHIDDAETGETVCTRCGRVLHEARAKRSIGTEVRQSNQRPRNRFGGGLGGDEAKTIYEIRGFQYDDIKKEIGQREDEEGALFSTEITEIMSDHNAISPATSNHANRTRFSKNKASLENMLNKVRNAITTMIEEEPDYNRYSAQWQQRSEEMIKTCQSLMAENFESYFSKIDPVYKETRFVILAAEAYKRAMGHAPKASRDALAHQQGECKLPISVAERVKV